MDLHVVIEPGRIVTPTLVLRSWSAEDAVEALEIYGHPTTAEAIGREAPIGSLAEMRQLLGRWNLQSSRCPFPQGLWAVEAVADGQLLGGATLLPFGPDDPRLVMGWHLRPAVRGRGVAGQIGHALAHQAFAAGDVEEVFVASSTKNIDSISVARRLGMTPVETHDWKRHGVRLEVLRMTRAGLHEVRPGISMDDSYNPEGLGDW